MALIFVDGFEHYGADKINLARGTGWSNIRPGTAFSTTFTRTGTYSLKMVGNASSPSAGERLIFGKNMLTVGIAFGMFFENLPTDIYTGFSLNKADGSPILTFQVQSDGSFAIHKGDITSTVIARTDSYLYAGTFNHIEFKVHIDNIVGSIQMKINNVQVLLIENINTGIDPTTAWNTAIGYNGNGGTPYYIDDFIVWDDTGSFCNDFLGPQRVLTIFPNGDGTDTDWTINGGAGPAYDTIDELSQDGDATYVRADTVGDKVSFTLPTLPTETIGIRGLFVPAIARIDDAGIGNLQVAMKSGTDVLAAPEVPLTPNYAYTRSAFEYDPATGIEWTKAGVEAAILRLEKSL